MSGGALSGLRVVDITTVIAGNTASSMLADHGAEVLKIEDPRRPDSIRQLEPRKAGISLWHKVAGRNKKALTLNLATEAGAEILRRLIKTTDILIENFRPGTMEKWGLGWEVLKQINPKLVMVRISGYGQDGPYAERPGFGTIAESFAGVPLRCGFPDNPPTLFSPFPLADDIAGMFATFSAMFAVYNRDHGTGKGQVVDIGLYEPLLRIVEDQVIAFDQLGLVFGRIGNRLPWVAPRGIFQARDGNWIAISAVSDATVTRLLTAVGGPELAADPRFKTNELRVQNADVLEDILYEWIGGHSRAEILEICQREDVVAGTLNDIEQIFSDPHVAYRQNIITVEDPDLGATRVPGIVPKFHETPGAVEYLSLPRGYHNEEIYREILGMSAEEVLSLQRAGVI